MPEPMSNERPEEIRNSYGRVIWADVQELVEEVDRLRAREKELLAETDMLRDLVSEMRPDFSDGSLDEFIERMRRI